MASRCKINFDVPDRIYYSGETINGSIELITHAPKTIRGIHITINGYGKVEIYSQKRWYTSFRKYLDSCTYVVGRKNGASFEYAPGIYDYTFNCKLPLTLPTSVSGYHGSIKYEVIVTIDRPFRFDNVFKCEFTVIRTLNLNMFPLYRQPKESIEENALCSGCCFGKPGIIKTKLRVPFSAYAPGQVINFVLEVANDSANDLGLCTVKLRKQIKFEAREPDTLSYYDTKTLERKCFSGVLRKSNKKFEAGIIVPFVEPSNSSEDSGIIRIKYKLLAIIKTGFCHINIVLKVPIIIGTTPLTMSNNE